MENTTFRDADWYGDDLGNNRYTRCSFTGVDLTETRSRGAVFEDCSFSNCKFNVSEHVSTAFVGCDIRRSSFFDATLDGCKLTGTVLIECELKPLTVRGGNWSGIVLRGADLAGLDLSGVRLIDADLSEADLTEAVLRGCDLTHAIVRGTNLAHTDLRQAQLSAVELTTARLDKTLLDLAGAVALAETLGVAVEV